MPSQSFTESEMYTAEKPASDIFHMDVQDIVQSINDAWNPESREPKDSVRDDIVKDSEMSETENCPGAQSARSQLGRSNL